MQANKPKQYCTTVCHLVSTASTPCENGVLQNSYQLPHQYTKTFYMYCTDRQFLIVLASLLLWPWDSDVLPDCTVLSRQHICCLQMHLLHVRPDVEELVHC